jgi:hypothetical protein
MVKLLYHSIHNNLLQIPLQQLQHHQKPVPAPLQQLQLDQVSVPVTVPITISTINNGSNNGTTETINNIKVPKALISVLRRQHKHFDNNDTIANATGTCTGTHTCTSTGNENDNIDSGITSTSTDFVQQCETNFDNDSFKEDTSTAGNHFLSILNKNDTSFLSHE